MKTTCLRSIRALPACGLLLAVCLVLASPGRAGEAPKAGPNYRVQPGDTLQVTLWNEDDVKDVVVDPEGNLAYPLVGMLQVRGLTLAEVTTQLTEALKKHVKRPRVTVTLKAAKAQPLGIYVMGAVAKAGPLEWVEGMTVKDALGLAGGLAPNADAAHATLNSTQKGSLTVDLEKLARGEATENPTVSPGDMLVVPPRQFATPKDMLTVFVAGQVNRPGMIQLTIGARLSDAVSAAGGPTATAALQNATLARAGTTTTVDLYAILRKAELAGNLPLQEGDQLIIPEARRQVVLVGAFEKPGAYPFRDGDTITTAVALGVPSPVADLRSAVLKRGGKETPIDLKAMLKTGNLQGDMPLQDGDAIFVPEGCRVLAYGAFNKPGPVTVTRDMGLVDVLLAAGGPIPKESKPDKAYVLRVVDGVPKQMPLNVKVAMEKGGPGLDFKFQDGDVLAIPSKGPPLNWQGIAQAFYMLTVGGGALSRW